MGQIDFVTNQQSTCENCVNVDGNIDQGTKEIYVLPDTISVEEREARSLYIICEWDES